MRRQRTLKPTNDRMTESFEQSRRSMFWALGLMLIFGMGTSCISQSKSSLDLLHSSIPVKQSASKPYKETSTIFRIQGERNTVFLLGSIHVLSESDYPLPLVLEDAYRQSDTLLLELSPFENQRMEELLLRKAYLPSPQKIWEILPPDLRDQLTEHFRSRGKDMAPYESMRPWYAAIQISSEEFASLGARYEFGLDAYFEQRALKDGKKIEGLETAEDQLKIFSERSEAEQLELLRQTLAEINASRTDFQRLRSSWRSGDLTSLARLLGSDQGATLTESSTVIRNRKWAQQIQDALRQSQNVMVIVGAGHLLGPRGLVQMLKENGHHPVQMKHE